MDRRTAIHQHLEAAANEILGFIKDSESEFKDRWVPSAYIKNTLEINFVSVPKAGTQYGEKGWVFASLARMLEDSGLIEHNKIGSRSFYRSKQRD